MPNSPRRKLQIFVSSTYKDLIDDRQAAVSAILKAGHIPAGMELFAAGDRSQMQTIKRWIDESDVFMLILAGRYGSIEPESDRSYIEEEYEYAISLGKPYFAVVIDSETLNDRVKAKGTEILELKRRKEYDAFHTKVTSKICTFFKDVKDIKLAVYDAMREIEERFPFAGWVPAASVTDTNVLVNDINRLTQERDGLKDELMRVQEAAANNAWQAMERADLWPMAVSLAKRPIAVPVKEHPMGEEFCNVVPVLDEFIKAEFPEAGETAKFNELGAFYYLAPDLIAGLRRESEVTVKNYLLSLYSLDWSLADLIELASENIYRLSSKGKRLCWMLRERHRELKIPDQTSPNIAS